MRNWCVSGPDPFQEAVWGRAGSPTTMSCQVRLHMTLCVAMLCLEPTCGRSVPGLCFVLCFDVCKHHHWLPCNGCGTCSCHRRASHKQRSNFGACMQPVCANCTGMARAQQQAGPVQLSSQG